MSNTNKPSITALAMTVTSTEGEPTQSVSLCPALVGGLHQLQEQLGGADSVLKAVLAGKPLDEETLRTLTERYDDRGMFRKEGLHFNPGEDAMTAMLALSQVVVQARGAKWGFDDRFSVNGEPGTRAHAYYDGSCCSNSAEEQSRELTVIFERCDDDTQGALYAIDPSQKDDEEGQCTYWFIEQKSASREVVERFGPWETVEMGAERFPVEGIELTAAEFINKLNALPGITVTARQGLTGFCCLKCGCEEVTFWSGTPAIYTPSTYGIRRHPKLAEIVEEDTQLVCARCSALVDENLYSNLRGDVEKAFTDLAEESDEETAETVL